MNKIDWCEVLIDSHIADWNEEFLSKFSPKNYVDMISLANVDSCMIYSSCHNGNCYYPTKIGHQHNNLKGRDVLGEIVNLCNKKNIGVVMYYSVIYNNWVYNNYPDWRIVTVSGKPAGENNRYGVVCPNSPYRDFVVGQVAEICKSYEFKRIFFDMTFWPAVCYCKYCSERYKKETGEDLPKIINWEDEKWLKFQRKREEWIREFAGLCTSTVKKLKPEVLVTHQFSTSLHSWSYGVPAEISEECDYTSGDFYGDSIRHSLACKVFTGLTKTKPFEFFVSRCLNLRDHTTTKSQELMSAQAFQVMAHCGRIIFIDAINPDGTLEKEVYEKIGRIYREMKKYKEYLGGEPVQDVGIYFSFESKISQQDNGKELAKGGLSSDFPHLNGIIEVCRTLMSNHIPFGIVTKRNLNEISRYKAIILPNVMMMDEGEVDAFKDYVKNGGSIYASKYTSLFDKRSGKKENFMLGKLFGVSYEGITQENVTYITPRKNGTLKWASDINHLILFSEQIKVKLNNGKILATLTLPYTNPKDTSKFASIHSNPPGILTSHPAIVINQYGKGKVCYSTGDIEGVNTEVHQKAFLDIVNMLAGKKYFFEMTAPKSVELIAFKQSEKSRYILNFLNFQPELPNIPVRDIKVRLRLPSNEKPVRLNLLPDEKKSKFKFSKNTLEFSVPEIRTFAMFELLYGGAE